MSILFGILLIISLHENQQAFGPVPLPIRDDGKKPRDVSVMDSVYSKSIFQDK